MMFLRDTQKNETSWWSSARGALSLFWSLVRYVEHYLFVIRNEGVTCRTSIHRPLRLDGVALTEHSTLSMWPVLLIHNEVHVHVHLLGISSRVVV